jgi:hypothetical protein
MLKVKKNKKEKREMENLEKAMYQKMLEQAMGLLEKLANKEVYIASLKKKICWMKRNQ